MESLITRDPYVHFSCLLVKPLLLINTALLIVGGLLNRSPLRWGNFNTNNFFLLMKRRLLEIDQALTVAAWQASKGERKGRKRERRLGREGKHPFLSLFRFSLFPPLLPSLPFIFLRLPRRLSVLLECLRWNKLTRTTTCGRKWQ